MAAGKTRDMAEVTPMVATAMLNRRMRRRRRRKREGGEGMRTSHVTRHTSHVT